MAKRSFRSRDTNAILAYMDELSSDGSCSDYEDFEDDFDCSDDGILFEVPQLQYNSIPGSGDGTATGSAPAPVAAGTSELN